MLKKILLASIFAITAITNVTHAEDDMKTVASKAYVDTKIETKQLKIPAANTPGVGAGETVMTYTATGNGQIGERGLYSDISSYDATTDGDKLITASALNATFTNLPTTPTTKLECANESDGCTLWTIVDQTAYGNGLPSGYTRLEYIESTGTQYIDTGLTDYKNTDIFDMKIYPSTTGTFFITGQNPSGSNENIGIFIANNRITFQFTSWTENRISYDITRNSWHTLVATNGKMIFDGIEITGNPGSEFSVNSVLYCGASSPRPSDRPFVGRFGYFRVLDKNEVYRFNGIPAKRYSDNAVGMYDTVSGRFFTNAATSGPDFTAGPPAN